jgi:hypothetical protein
MGIKIEILKKKYFLLKGEIKKEKLIDQEDKKNNQNNEDQN